jgi:hypothetical protein
MIHDPIVDEVRKAREEYARKFNFDLRAIYHDLKRKEAESDHVIVNFSTDASQAASLDKLPVVADEK